jgi:2-polyprenyl-3-methyl-5-hydroxy-6-metoxy-1,4-benzoquinol methylase
MNRAEGCRSRAEQRDLVRRGYDQISLAYRSDDGCSNRNGPESTSTYIPWLEELAALLLPPARILDLGCGAGVPADRWLADAGFDITGVDISEVQIQRARTLVPDATFVCDDLATFDVGPGSLDAVISFYALIHVPLEDQRELFPRIVTWLRPGGLLMAIVGTKRWTGVEDYFGTPMFWDHADAPTYVSWLESEGLDVLWSRFIPEGSSGHTLLLARKP